MACAWFHNSHTGLFTPVPPFTNSRSVRWGWDPTTMTPPTLRDAPPRSRPNSVGHFAPHRLVARQAHCFARLCDCRAHWISERSEPPKHRSLHTVLHKADREMPSSSQRVSTRTNFRPNGSTITGQGSSKIRHDTISPGVVCDVDTRFVYCVV